MRENNIRYPITNVEKAIELLEKLAESAEPVTLQALAAGVGFSPNKTSRVLATLVDRGLVERSRFGTYCLGAITAALGKKLLDSSNRSGQAEAAPQREADGEDIISYAHPIMEELARRHDEAVYMTVIKGHEVLFLNMVDCHQPIKAEPLMGRRFPFFTNAAGKVIKAVESWDLVERLLSRGAGRNGEQDLEKLARELEEIKATGVAVDNGGLGEGIISVAVAVRDYAGKVVGAITLLGPSFRMLAERIENEIIPSLREGAGLLSAQFGYVPA